MIKEKFTFQGLGDICYQLRKFKDVTEDWEVDFYNIYDQHVLHFENDEETMERLQDEDDTYSMVTEWMDLALQMGKQY